ncbi:GDSL-type esterase/lipase family protein [Sphingomonas abietis]|uniref:GDSL-type esterase/lipase family protein n=1 Tax=Sphingomonas abietis TaxID=3012344 RepID=A0ABY7NMM4_9SPHN|nr:GDSL-type esterase/lipase family protein [Sphingomonas abietis]WBO22080.1 GDSL-type esterase/lipase family protein [Sphingomonas abietis]
MNFRAGVATLMFALAIPALAHAEPSQAQKDQWARENDERLHNDWPWLGKYKAANAALPARSKEPRIVFMGDSITENWHSMVPEFFAAGRVGRGISGQTTPQILLRFRQDVLDLHPAVVQILAGTNDIAGNTGPMTMEETQANIRSMMELAHAHGVRVIIASVPPAARLPWAPGLAVTDKIEALNAWLKTYAAETGSVYADYWSALQDGHGGFHAGWALDGVHPNKIGYAVMAPIAQKAIAAALARPAPAAISIVDMP